MSAQTFWAPLSSLVDQLSIERRLLEYLLFKLTALELILAAGAPRFLARATTEIERVVEIIGSFELARAVAVSGVAEACGVPSDDMSLEYLAERTPEPLRTLFADHHEGFLVLAREITDSTDHNRRMAASALGGIRADLAAPGKVGALDVPKLRFQEVGYQETLGVLGDLPQPSLEDWLRS